MKTLHDKHIDLLDSVNYALTQKHHDDARLALRYWRQGVEDAGLKLDLCAADWHYMNKGIERDMTAGVFLDWKPEQTPPVRFIEPEIYRKRFRL